MASALRVWNGNVCSLCTLQYVVVRHGPFPWGLHLVPFYARTSPAASRALCRLFYSNPFSRRQPASDHTRHSHSLLLATCPAPPLAPPAPSHPHPCPYPHPPSHSPTTTASPPLTLVVGVHLAPDDLHLQLALVEVNGALRERRHKARHGARLVKVRPHKRPRRACGRSERERYGHVGASAEQTSRCTWWRDADLLQPHLLAILHVPRVQRPSCPPLGPPACQSLASVVCNPLVHHPRPACPDPSPSFPVLPCLCQLPQLRRATTPPASTAAHASAAHAPKRPQTPSPTVRVGGQPALGGAERAEQRGAEEHLPHQRRGHTLQGGRGAGGAVAGSASRHWHWQALKQPPGANRSSTWRR